MNTILKIKLIKTLQIQHKETGQEARRVRMAAGMTLRQMARALGFSASYLCDLENGNRKWNVKLARRFEAILERQGEAIVSAMEGKE